MKRNPVYRENLNNFLYSDSYFAGYFILFPGCFFLNFFLSREIANTCGYMSVSMFRGIFRERFGCDLIRNYSRVKEVDDYKNESSFPSVHISYMFPVNTNIDLGLAMGFAGFKSDKSFSEYDQLLTDRTIKESLFSIAVIGKYGFDMELIRPYLLTGVSFTNSSVRTEGAVTFTDDERSILVQGGARSGHFGVPLRAGVDIRLTDAFNAFIEVGTGLSFLQLGGVIKIGR